MDIADIVPGEIEIEIKHPKTGEGMGIFVKLMSYDDARMKSVRKKITDRRLYLDARGKNFKADELEENRNELTFAAMVGWRWDGVTFEGRDPEFNRKEVFAVFNKYAWFVEQLDEVLGESKNFF